MIIDTEDCVWVRYKITTNYGFLRIGDEVNVKLIQYDKDTKRGLIYHPNNGKSCGSFSICKQIENGLWVEVNENCYVNIS